jgi:5-(carboxyamino)imidazole ribonucleotide synthase
MSSMPMTPEVLLPGARSRVTDGPVTLGVMGGGQLGRMFVHAAQALGYRTAVLDPDANSPAGCVSHVHVQTAYDDPAGLAQLAACCDAVTTEFENVPAQALQTLAARRPVAPGAQAVSIAQDRVREKAHFVQFSAQSGVTVAPYAVIESAADVAAVPAQLFPGILKTSRLGYDGKGQVGVNSAAELAQAWAKLSQVGCVLEQKLPLAAECSVIVARGRDGQMVHLPPQLNLHRQGILAVTEAHDKNMPLRQAEQAVQATKLIADGLGYVGVLCVEFFVLQDGSLVVNEMAPRPHNSGHYSIDACDQSQFDLQVRAMAGLPLVQPSQHSAALMLNLLGDVWLDAAIPGQPDWASVLALPGAHLHLYGKLDPKRARKMGHLTLTGSSFAQVRAAANQAAALLGLEGY